jgi:DNA-binding CsgD family transcriptional regulator
MLYGREAERARLGVLLGDARRSRSGVLVVRGEAGVGKSALLEDAREQAFDMQVLRGSGIESEAQVPFAALHQIVRPILGRLSSLPGPQAGALRGALGLEVGESRDRFLISLAVLSLLAEAAEDRPILCLVDDAHWLDPASSDALVFVGRRLEAEGIAMLFAVREHEGHGFEAPGLPELALGGLGPQATAELMGLRADVALSPETCQRLVAATGGNPLALLELPDVVSEAQLVGAELLLAPLPVGERIERAFLARVHQLPEDTQTLLLVASAEDSGELAIVLRAAAQMGVASQALDAAEREGLARVRGDQLEFHHPLVRSAGYHSAPLSRRHVTHRALASVLNAESEADRRAWHLASATVGPDPAVVNELDQAAQRARKRSGFAAASLAFERAATLTSNEAQRVDRVIAAAENAWLGGRVQRAATLLTQAQRLDSEPTQRADIHRYLGLIEMNDGSPADACQLLLRAAAQVAPLDGHRALELLFLASVAATYADDEMAAVAIAQLARGLAVDSPIDHMLVALLTGLGAHFVGDFAAAAPALRLALSLARRLDDDSVTEESVPLLFAGRAALYLGDDRAFYGINQEATARARAAGLLVILAQILPRVGYAELWGGRWASASANLSEGLRLAREIGQHDLVAYQLVLLALIAAHRGDEDECRSLAGEGLELSSARRFVLATQSAHWALTVLELGLGRTEEALLHAGAISNSCIGLWAMLDRVEAAVQAGEREAARDWAAYFAPWAENGGAAWARAVLLHCQGLLSDDKRECERLFRAALDAHAKATRPFERSRTELALGELLRRDRRRVEARDHLRAALNGFEGLGARLWAERARMELRASGQVARRRDPSTTDELTAQELQIVQLVVQGLSNREVAAQSFLSARTIDAHLRNVFRKLNISSRTQLARLDLDGHGERMRPARKPAVPPLRA